MASPGKTPSDLLICAICTEPYDDNQHKAKFLACHHTFCSHCLNEWLRKKGQTNTGSIQCPNCNQLTVVPENGIDGLQTNFYIESMKENSSKHELNEPKLAGSANGCPEHGNQTMFFFCETCSTAICRDCTVLDHQKAEGHVIIGIKKATESHRHTLQDQLIRSRATHAEIQNAIQEAESEIQTIKHDKDLMTENLVAFIQYAQRQLEQYQQKATDAISEHHTIQHEKLIGHKQQLQQAERLLDKHISQGEQMTKSDDINDIISSTNKLEKVTEINKLNSGRQNCFTSNLISVPDLLNDKVGCIGKTCLPSFLPASVVIRNDEITAGLKSVIAVELLYDVNKKDPSLSPVLTVQITDPHYDELPATLNTTNSECTVTFTPQVSGRHDISVICLGQKLKSEQTHIMVNSNNPVLKFGTHGNGKGTFNGPYSIAMDNTGVLYVADSENKLIQKFSDNGEFISQFCVNDNDNECTTLDMVLDQNNGLIYCIETGYKNKAFYPRQMMLEFNLEGELQHSYKLSNCTSPYFIAIDTEQDILISDASKKCLCKLDKQGKYLSCMGDLEFPTFSVIGEDNSIIVADANNDCICIYNPDGKFRHKFGTSGTRKGQLKSPYGIATDGDLILVADKENNRIQVFRCNGTFVSTIESKDDPLKMPCGLLITGDGYVYVADMGNHCIKKYKYKWMTQSTNHKSLYCRSAIKAFMISRLCHWQKTNCPLMPFCWLWMRTAAVYWMPYIIMIAADALVP